MPLYRCPKCGRTVEKPEGAYYCKVCGRDAIMQKLEVNPSKPLKLRWVEDDAGIYWTATKDFLHALYYDEEDKVYVWYIFDWADWEDVKRGRLFVPIYSYKVIETTDLEEAKRWVEENMIGRLIPAYPERVDELVMLRNM
ncbi:hypothetical protein DRO69_02600, partial [Candidatus Bathyarchaeota archaeon]